MTRVLILWSCFCWFSITAMGQPLTTLINYRGALVVFEKGAFRQIDHLTPVAIYEGGNSLAYVAHDNSLQLYYNQKTYAINDSPPDSIFNGDYLLSYLSYKQLKVFDTRKVKTISGWVSKFWPTDSLVAFEDNYTGKLMVYQNLRQTILEESIFAGAIKNLQVAVNIIAYTNSSNQLTIFYHDSIYRLDFVYGDNIYAAGQNTLAYVKSGERSFELFYKGATYQLEALEPRTFKAGRDLVAYVTTAGEFKAFCNGSIFKLSSYEPAKFEVKDSVIYFSDAQNYFHVFMGGQTYTLENFVPDIIKASFSTVAYLDQQGRLKVFSNGLSKIVSYEQIKKFEVTRNLVKYHTGLNDVSFYYLGNKIP